jgi:hypothetical protein
MKTYLTLCCIAGTIVPYSFALPFFLSHGLDLRLMLQDLFANRISSFFAADLLLSSVIFLSWSRRESKTCNISGWWLVLTCNLAVGLSLALPLFLLKRLDASAD